MKQTAHEKSDTKKSLAIKLKDGRIILDSESGVHSQIMEKFNVSVDDVVARGFKKGSRIYWLNKDE